MRSLALALLVLAALLMTAAPAAAHAVLESTTPADGERLDTPPGEVTVELSEPVSAEFGAVRVFNAEGERVDEGDAGTAADPSILRVGLPGNLPDGTYAVTWRAVSADGHPVRGAFLFVVGEATGSGDELLTALAEDGDVAVPLAATLTRWVTLTASLLAAGGVAFLRWVHGGTGGERRRLHHIVLGAAAVAVIATLAGVVVQALRVSGLGLGALRPGVLGATLAGPFGIGVALRLAGLAGVAIALRRERRPGIAATLSAIAVAGSFLLEGHTLTSEPVWLMVTADAVHLGAGAAWFGGLVLLGAALRQRRFDDDPVGAARLVARFSALASIWLLAVSAAGLALAWVQVRALRALTSTAYGWTLVSKTALVLAVIVVAAYNHRRLVPAVQGVATRVGRGIPIPAGGAGSEGAPGRVPAAQAWQRLGRTVRLEVAGLVAVLGVTAVLVALQPAADAAGITGAYSTTVPLGEEHQVNLVVDPNRAGVNDVHLYVLDATGRPADLGGELTLRLSQPARDLGPIERRPQVAGPGHWVLSGPELSIPGQWVIEVDAAPSEFGRLSAQIPVVVGG